MCRTWWSSIQASCRKSSDRDEERTIAFAVGVSRGASCRRISGREEERAIALGVSVAPAGHALVQFPLYLAAGSPRVQIKGGRERDRGGLEDGGRAGGGKGKDGAGKEQRQQGVRGGKGGRERTTRREGRDKGKGKDTDAGETEGDATTPGIKEGGVRA